MVHSTAKLFSAYVTAFENDNAIDRSCVEHDIGQLNAMIIWNVVLVVDDIFHRQIIPDGHKSVIMQLCMSMGHFVNGLHITRYLTSQS